MRVRKSNLMLFGILLVATLFVFGVRVNAQSSFSGTRAGVGYSQYQYRPSFQTYYGADVGKYWPILGDPLACEARQDLLLNVAPAGCQPAVVRSDLLAEQNVPVFCQIDALKINPLIDISQIKSISFKGEYPPEIVGAGFHPARAALRTHDRLLGKPLINNVGYIVLVLRQEPDERKLPNFVNVSLQAEIIYDAGNAYGIGRADFILEPLSEQEWETERFKQSFWNGRYFVRLERADANFADVSIYYGNNKINTLRVERGKTSSVFYLPGMYCRAGVQVAFDDYVIADDKAIIEVSSDAGVDIFDVYKGSRFLDSRCSISDIKINDDGETGKITGSCSGKRFELELKSLKDAGFGIFVVNGKTLEPTEESSEYSIDFKDIARSRIGKYTLTTNNELIKVVGSSESFVVVNSTGSVNETIIVSDKDWVLELWNALKDYKNKTEQNPDFKIGELQNKEMQEGKTYYDEAIKNYEKIADDYPVEKKADVEGAFYGEEALRNAIELSKTAGAEKDRARLLNKYLDIYGKEVSAEKYSRELNEIYEIDASKSSEVVEFDDRARVIRVVGFKKARQEAKATFLIEGRRVSLGKNDSTELIANGRKLGELKIDNINARDVSASVYCTKEENRRRRYGFALDGVTQELCETDVRLSDIDAGQSVKIRLIPFAGGTQTVTNVNVAVGIEKRAIKLTPDKALEKIENLNESIKKWEKISDRLGNVVTGLKGACFATSAILTFKNFMSGLSGETLARQEVMKSWRVKCQGLVPNEYPTIDACYLAKAGEINSDVAQTTQVYNSLNGKIQQIQSKHSTSSGVFGQSVNSDAVRNELANEARARYGSVTVDTSSLKNSWLDAQGNEKQQITISELLSEENVNNGVVTTEDIKQLMLYAELQNKQVSSVYKNDFKDRFVNVADRVNEIRLINNDLKNAQAYEQRKLATPFYADSDRAQTRYANVRNIDSGFKTTYGASQTVNNIATARVPAAELSGERTGEGFDSGIYVLGLDNGGGRSGVYSVVDVWEEKKLSNGEYGYEKLSPERVRAFLDTYKIGNIESVESLSYSNEITPKDRLVRYYETEPYRGMPAIVPFDVRNGWYAATRQTLPVFGGIGAFDASGRVTSFFVCNVGENGRVEFETGLGDDLCQQINLNTGQTLGVFPGMNEREARELIERARRAIEDAANQYGNKQVRILGQPFEVGAPSTGKPGTQCQDFMSPTDCLLLFNVCDPVICPSSRCDLGGTFPVANVPQTGIIGSVFLCLPNIREGIVVPVCLTGIQAGIDGFVSIMRSYRDCLQESVETGNMVGLCDQIYSIYICDFFWNQVAPFVNVLIPKIIEIAYGQGVRGGAEYLTVQAAWQNMENSLNYFTQSYAVNSLQAFSTRSAGQYGYPLALDNAVAQIGSQFCKSFISAKAPAAFKTLIEPDSPPQFHAWFDSARYSDATVPATARYKVFYHIFAGKDSGVYFDVYLKSPPESGYYATAPVVPVGSGFIPRGEYATQTRDFTAPEGYKELCVRVNAQEECGFKQVSTSFAADYLRDMYVKDQITNNRITSERECIGGSISPYTLLNPNLQSGVENTIAPQIYNRGVVRICATENPGKGTDETRFVEVGYCDEQKLKCWLDKRSVNDAISDENIGMKNATLQELEQITIENLAKQGEILLPGDAVSELRSLEEQVGSLSGSQNKINALQEVLRKANELETKLFYNAHKAWLLLIKGRANEIVARSLIAKEDAKDDESSTDSEVAAGDFLFNEIPEYDNERRRVVVNFGGSLGTYGLNERNELEKFEGGKWVEVQLVDNSLVGLRNALLDYKVKNPYKTGEIKVEDRVEEIRQQDNGQQTTQCALSNAKWIDKDGNEISEAVGWETGRADGEIVYLEVSGSENCENEAVEFKIWEDDIIGNDFVNRANANIKYNKVKVEWKPLFVREGFIAANPEYFFNAQISGMNEIIKSKNLRVTRPAEKQETQIEEETEEPAVVMKNYSLRDESYLEKSAIVQMLYFGEERTGIYFLRFGIYVDIEGEDLLVGSEIRSSGRLYIRDDKIELARNSAGEAVAEHLRFLQNKNYNDLKRGVLQKEAS